MHEEDAFDRDILDALKGVYDPELGVNIVDLGLVYRAARGEDGIEVDITMTTRACPLGEMIVREAQDALRARFPDAKSVEVLLVWDPPWSPERMNAHALRQFG